MNDYEPEYVEGLRLFNEGRYWESHDVLEQLWRRLDKDHPHKKFYQAIILLAAAFLHRDRARENKRRSAPPALRCYRSCLTKLEGLPNEFLGLDLEDLRGATSGCFRVLESGLTPDAWPDAPVLQPKRE